MLRDTSKYKEIKQLINHILGTNLAIYLDSQAFPGKFIDDIEYSKSFAIRSHVGGIASEDSLKFYKASLS
jgi:hypothetical protein